MEPIRARAGAQPKKEKDKKGGGAWAPGAGAGAGSLEVAPLVPAGVGAGGEGTLSVLLSGLTRATGLGAAAASKFGLATLLLAAGTVLAAVALLHNADRSDFAAPPEGEVFTARPAQSPQAREDGEDAQSSAGPSALDYLAQANSTPEELAAQGASAKEQTPDAAGAKGAAPLPNIPAIAQAASRPGQTQALKRTKAPGGASAPSSQASLKLVPSLAGKVGGNFQDVYHKGSSSAFAVDRASAGVGRRMRGVIQRSGAQEQLVAVNLVSRRAARAGAADGASSTASSAFDASVAQGPSIGQSGAASQGRMAADGYGDAKQIGLASPPPPVDNPQNQTPYQGLIYAGMAALMIGQMLVQAAGKMVGDAQKAPDPATKSQLIMMANALAAAAMGAGAAAGAIGAQLVSKYNQMTQAMPFMIGGAVIVAQAAIVLVTAELAGSEAESGVASAAADAAQSAMGSLSQLGQMAGAMGNKDQKTPEQQAAEDKQKREQAAYKMQQELRNRQVHIDSSGDHFTGEIKGPGVPE